MLGGEKQGYLGPRIRKQWGISLTELALREFKISEDSGPILHALPLTISKSCPRGVETLGASTVSGSEMREIPKPGFRPRPPVTLSGSEMRRNLPFWRHSGEKENAPFLVENNKKIAAAGGGRPPEATPPEAT